MVSWPHREHDAPHVFPRQVTPGVYMAGTPEIG